MQKNNKNIIVLGLMVFFLFISAFHKVKDIKEQIEIRKFMEDLEENTEANKTPEEKKIKNFDDSDFIALKGMDYLKLDNTLIEVNNSGLYLEYRSDIAISKVIEADSGYIMVGSIKSGESRFKDKVKDNVSNAIILNVDKDFRIKNYNTFTLKSDTVEFSVIDYAVMKSEKTKYRGHNVDNTFLDIVKDDNGNYITVGCSLYFEDKEDTVYYIGTIAKYDQNLQLVSYNTLQSENNVMFSKIVNSDKNYGVGAVFADNSVLNHNTGKVEGTVVKYDKSLENSNVGEMVTLLDRKEEQKVDKYIFDYYEYSSKLSPTIPDSYIKGIVEIDNEFILLCNAIYGDERLSGGEDYIVRSSTFGKVVAYDENLNIENSLDYTKNNLINFNGLLFKDILVNDRNEIIIVGDISYNYGEYSEVERNQGMIFGGKNGGFNEDYKFKPSEVFILTFSPKLEIMEEIIYDAPYIYYKQYEESKENFFLDDSGNHIKVVENKNDLNDDELYFNSEKINNIQLLGEKYVIYGKSGYINSELTEKLPEEYLNDDGVNRIYDTYITVLNEDFSVLKSYRLTGGTKTIINDFIINGNENAILVGNSYLEYSTELEYYSRDVRGKEILCEFEFNTQ